MQRTLARTRHVDPQIAQPGNVAETPWYYLNGIYNANDFGGVWEAKGADNLATSLVDKTNARTITTYNVTGGWTAGAGWTLDGTQFNSGLVCPYNFGGTPADGGLTWMIWVNSSGFNYRYPMGGKVLQSPFYGQAVRGTPGSTTSYWGTTSSAANAGAFSGILSYTLAFDHAALTVKLYRNGVLEPVSMSGITWNGGWTGFCGIGTLAGPGNWGSDSFAGDIYGFLYLRSAASGANIAALHAAAPF